MNRLHARQLRMFAVPLMAMAGLFALLWPQDALAWGPLAHLEFSRGALEQLHLVSPATRQLLERFANEFLYGSLAADIIVGKNLAPYATHCHNWRVGFSVLDRARGDAQTAFSFGFLAHLAVDTVAHNYYVPYKTVQGARTRGAGHAYWELRYDQKLSPDLWRLARQVSSATFREHDEHLEACLSESAVIPFSVSKRLFGGLLLAARLKKWQRMSELLAQERALPLHAEEVGECRRLAVHQVVSLLKDGPRASCTRADPTGGRNLHFAEQLRRQLRAQEESRASALHREVERLRPVFREAIHGRLELPDLKVEDAWASRGRKLRT